MIPNEAIGGSVEPRVVPPRMPDLAGSLRSLRRGASGAFLVSVTGTGLGFLSNMVIARLTGRADYGIYALMVSWVSLLSVVAQAGQDISIVRFMPGYIHGGAWGEVRGLRRGVGLLVFATSVCVGAAGCAIVRVLGAQHDAAWRDTFYIGFATLPILTQLQQSGALHRAFKRPVVTNLYSTVLRPLVVIPLMLLLALVVTHPDAPLASAASALAALLALAASAWHMSHAWPGRARGIAPRYELRRWASIGSQLSLLSIIVAGGNWLSVLILGALMGTGDVGPYYAALRMATFALFAQQSVNVVLAPMIAERHDAGDMTGLQVVAARAARLGLAGALAVGVFFAVAGKWILGLFGHDFGTAYVPLLILLSGYCASTAFGEVGFMLSMTKYQKQASLFVLVGIVINLAAALLLVPRMGATGAAIGAALSLVAWRGVAWRYVTTRLGIDPSVFGKVTPTSEGP